MYRITKVLKSMPNNNYTGIVHMAKYVDTLNKKNNGIIFLEHTFDRETFFRKGSFYEEEYEDEFLLDKDQTEKEFGVTIEFMYGQGELISSIQIDGDYYFLYDDSLGTSNGANIDLEDTQIGDHALRRMFSRLNSAKKIVSSPVYQEMSSSIDELNNKIDTLRGAVDALEEQSVLIKQKRRSAFEEMMNKK